MSRYVVIACGSRTFADPDTIVARLAALRSDIEARGRALVIVEGAATGPDRAAGRWALRAGVERHEEPAAWDECGTGCPPVPHRRRSNYGREYCPVAGPRRNQLMLDKHTPVDLVLAFVDKPLRHSKGTADMARRASKAGVPIEVVHSAKRHVGFPGREARR